MITMIEYIDATDDPEQRVDYPHLVEAFVALGFVQVGRCLVRPTSSTLEELAGDYGDLRDVFLEHASIPTPVLRSPDRSAFVEVSWFWDSPEVRIRTMLEDGALIETLRTWDNPPPIPEIGKKHGMRAGIDQDMERDDNPQGGRSVLVVAECTPSEQWSRHIEHVARYSAERLAKPIDHADLGVSMGISRAAYDHSVAVVEGYTRYWRPLIISFGVVGFSVIGVLLVISGWAFIQGDPNSGGAFQLAALAASVLGAIFAMPFTRLVIGRVRSVPRRLRPVFVEQNEAG